MNMIWFRDFNWRSPVDRIFLCASPTVGAPSMGGGGPAASPTAAPTVAPTSPTPVTSGPSGVPPVSPTGQPSGQPTVPPNGNEANIAILRSNHELITRLGGPEAVQAAVTRAQTLSTLHTEGTQLAEALGFTKESFEAGFAQDPADVIGYLRQQYETAQRGQGPDGRPNQPTVEQLLDRRLAPLEQTLNIQRTKEVNGQIDGELGRVLSDHAVFKGKSNIPPDVQGFVMDLAREHLKYDREGIQKIFKGDLSPVSAAFGKGLDTFFKAVNAYNAWNGQPASTNVPNPGNGGQPTNGGIKPFNLQALINGEEDAFQGLSTTRR